MAVVVVMAATNGDWKNGLMWLGLGLYTPASGLSGLYPAATDVEDDDGLDGVCRTETDGDRDPPLEVGEENRLAEMGCG